MSENILEVTGATVRFGGVMAVDSVSIAVSRGQILGLVGPNGAGKTTLLNAVSGVLPLAQGTVTFEGTEIGRVPSHRRIAIGIGRTFQGVELFGGLSVQENLMVGRHHMMRAGLLSSALYYGAARREAVAHRRRVEEVIEFFELERYRRKRVADLAYGIPKIVGVARALCGEPRLLLLDEVASGLNREEKEDLARFLLRLKHSQAMTMVWVEHDVRMVSELADTIAVLDYGKLVASGAPELVLRDPKVRRVFLGEVDEG